MPRARLLLKVEGGTQVTEWLRKFVRSRRTPRLAALLFVASLAASFQTDGASAASPSALTVGDYVVRMVRAMGLDGQRSPSATPLHYVNYLMQRGYISPGLATTLAFGRPLTREIALGLSRATVPPAPAFLSETYLTRTFLPPSGEALGFVRPGERDALVLATFATNGGLGLLGLGKECPTPRRVRGKKDKRCPGPP